MEKPMKNPKLIIKISRILVLIVNDIKKAKQIDQNRFENKILG